MKRINLNELGERIISLSLFRNLKRHPLFKSFIDYTEAEGKSDKLEAYSAMVSEIYSAGVLFSDFAVRLVLENENPYIKAVANGFMPSPDMESAKARELDTLSLFAELSSSDFCADLGVDYLAPFAGGRAELHKAYAGRLEDIHRFGYGIFSSVCMFRLSDSLEIEPIISADRIGMDKFVGYTAERQRIIDNTEAFISGKPAANALLCGDAGTGKSSTVKAVANSFFDKGVRLIELRKDQLRHLPLVMGRISENPLKFIIFIDDLSFNNNDDNFSMLKATLEGSASAKAKNAVIYATSNRRHIIKESFADREGGDVHRNDTLQETLSLSERFGLTVLFQRPDKKLYLDIVHELADRYGIKKDRAELDIEAEAFALGRSSRSARCAEQYVEGLVRKA